VAAISVDPPDASRNLRAKRGYTYAFLSDPDAATIKLYDLVHPKAGPNEQDIARPAEFLLDPSGTVRWVNLTESYWIRATPDQLLQATSALR
jgi:peroxiredoxin